MKTRVEDAMRKCRQPVQLIRTTDKKEKTHLLDDVPQVSVVLKCQHSVFCGDFVKPRLLLVAEKCVRSPDVIPTVVSETYLRLLSKVDRIEDQSWIRPVLTKIHTDRVVLHTSK